MFIPRFKRKVISNETYFFTCLRYIHQNPIRHGFTKELMDWAHSSIHAFVGNRQSKVEREEIMNWFANNYKASSKEFWDFHNEGWDLDDLDLEV
ncbi:MAG: putative transposase [Arenicella sp.]